jgi:hypothetical protein
MKMLTIVSLVLTLFLAACTSYMYGVPRETWDQMSEPERIEAMHVYEREQQASRQAAAERARQQAIERERERVRQAELARARQERIEAIHRGEGAYGELLRVRLQGGVIKVGDQHHRYEPITFTIADGETRNIGVADRKGREVLLVVTYVGGALSLDGIRFPYDRSWGKGRLYAGTGTSGPLQLRGVDVFIEVHSRSLRHERELPRLVIVREEPPQMVVREKETVRPPPVAVTEPVKQTSPPGRQSAPAAVETPPRSVEVVLLSGEMRVRGRNQPVEPVTLRLVEGETRKLTLKADGEAKDLSLRYRKGELFIDNGRAKGRDALHLPFEKEWKTGRFYRFDLRGKLYLEKVELKVTGVEGK